MATLHSNRRPPLGTAEARRGGGAGGAAARRPARRSRSAGEARAGAPAPKRACPAPRRVPLYDYKTRFNELLEKHKPLRAELLELRTSAADAEVELLQLREWREGHEAQLQRQRDAAVSAEARARRLAEDLGRVSEECAQTKDENAQLRDELNFAEAELKATKYTLNDTARKLTESRNVNEERERILLKQTEDILELQESTQKLHWERRNLHNKLQDLKGNIRVVFRVRPPISVGRPVAEFCFPDACTIELECFQPGATKRLVKHDFKFDRVFGPMSSQEDIWEEVSCLIQSALDGYNVCIFAYGQTGSGKTYTMEGTSDEWGVIPRCCEMIFDSVKQLSKSGWTYTVHASFLEIYNEHLFDLLDPAKDSKELDIRMVDAKGSDVYVTNLSEKEVTSAKELLKLAARAQCNRQTAATASNERSSRSHSVARVQLIAKHEGRALTLTSRICLVDLAGSESAKTTTRLKETKNINRSLSELGQVILALQQKQEHVPFRNSKLTRLLEPQLGGAAKALLVAAAAPYEDCCHESLSTLRFATQVGHCSTAAARRNLALAQPTTLHAKEV